jgi:hypothetical protein
MRSFARRTRVASRMMATAFLLSAASPGCAGRNGPADNPFEREVAPSQVRIIVINNDFNDATLFALGDGVRRRLGVITGKSEANYLIPWRLSGPMRIEISILAAGSCTTGEMQVDPGDTLELQILNETVRNGQCSGLRGRGD